MGLLDAATLAPKPEVYEMCAANRCGQFGKNWMCPPALGVPPIPDAGRTPPPGPAVRRRSFWRFWRRWFWRWCGGAAAGACVMIVAI
ncbi:MAG: DUF2284 domain-containing protein [Bifidobacteriaceae bacterium]|nr:DUF2284 domain-containing protein [Bifidobacteriaceae bacterium]